MDERELAAKYGRTEEEIERTPDMYERGDQPHSEGAVYSGSHLNAVGNKR